jgi:hypothetical protein
MMVVRRPWAGSARSAGASRPRRKDRAISELMDRATETAALEGVLAAVRGGLSRVLVVRGDAGIGKTVLLEWAAGQAHDMQLARVAGIQAEMGMGFAGLHQLLMPFLGGLDGLPGPQRWSLRSGWPPGRRRTGSWSGSRCSHC